MRKRNEIMLLGIILIVGIFLRLQLLTGGAGQGFFEPDNYLYAHEAQTILSNYLTIPSNNILSGFPTHTPFAENPGLGYFQVIVYLLLFKTVSLYDVMLALPVIFGILGMLITYLLTKKLTDNPYVPLLAMLFFAVIPAAVFRTSAQEWRGETFVPIFAMIPALFISGKNTTNKIMLFWLIIALVVVASLLMWTGGEYVSAAIFVFMAYLYLFEYISKTWKPIQAFIISKIPIFGLLTIGMLAAQKFIGPPGKIIGEIQATSIAYLNGAYGVLVFFLAVFYFIISSPFSEKIKDKQTYVYVLAFFIVTCSLQVWQQRWSALLVLPACIFAALGTYEIVRLLKSDKLFYYGIIILIPAIVLSSSLLNMIVATKTADFQTPATFQTLAWIKNNTPSNATFLTLWPDGSLIEGWANRTVYSDSMGAAGMGMATFPQFLYAKEGNLSFINKIHPDYLWIRAALLNETDSIKLMGNISINTSLNKTNLQALGKGTNLNDSNIKLIRVYNDTDGYVYKVN